MSKPPRKPSVVLVDPSLLSDEEKKELRVAAKKRIGEERKAAAQDAYLEQVLDEERRAGIPNEEERYITLDMAGHSDRIMLDGVVYFHGQTYLVRKSTYDVMAETVARGWDHEDEIGGANRDQYRRPRNTVLRPGQERVTTSQLLRGS